MESISVFEIIKVGIGPSSSHTMGPWRAALQFLCSLKDRHAVHQTTRIRTELYGSLAKTGIGHGTDVAIIMGLCGEDYTQINTSTIPDKIELIKKKQLLRLPLNHSISFNYEEDIVFLKSQNLEFHPNGMRFVATLQDDSHFSKTYYSVGGGFVVGEGEDVHPDSPITTSYPCHSEDDIRLNCERLNLSISELILLNETAWRSEQETHTLALDIWNEIKSCVFRGISSTGILPGGLNVKRRAHEINKLLLDGTEYQDVESWLSAIKNGANDFKTVNKWVSAFALAASEENASFGRIVTAPTNGASGVIPAVMMYAFCFTDNFDNDAIIKFILTAGEIGTLYKKGATISAALGGCQAEIGVSSSMAAGALVEAMNGNTDQVFQAAEIAMEHHLGLTCDPIAGLVQLPCIERNTMGAIKAITAANMALAGDGSSALLSLDDVIKAMWETAQDMHAKYKETSEGGLAKIPVNIVEC